MAYVALSLPVRNNITSAVTSRFVERKNKIWAELDTPRIKELVYDHIVPPKYAEICKTLPTAFLHQADHIYFKYRARVFDIRYSGTRPIPSTHSQHYTPAPIPELPEGKLKQALDDIVDRYAAVVTEEKQLQETLEKMFAKCKDLRQLLLVWPSALDFCNADIQRRHNAPAPKRFKPTDIEVTEADKLGLIKARL